MPPRAFSQIKFQPWEERHDMREHFDRLLVGVGIALLCLSLLASLAHLSKGSAVANQMGAVLSAVVVAVGLLDQWYLRRGKKPHK